MRISELAARTGTPATTLRYYESAGLLPASRTASGYRLYGEEAVERLAFVDAAKHLGLPLKEIASLLTVWKSGACSQVKAELRPLVEQRLRSAERRRSELDAFAVELTDALDRLDSLPDRPGRCDPECGFLASAAGSKLPPAMRRTAAGPPPAAGTAPSAVGAAETVNSRPGGSTSAPEPGRWRTAPVACSLTAQETRARADEWRRAMRGARRSPVTDGLRLTLPVERTSRVAELAVAEQSCCPFLDFRLQLDGPELHLDIRTSELGAPLLAALFGELPQPS
ncbi:MerR family transcriptional regulator [Streptomyces sp. XM4193]|uniref:MerR family transcriptional regulator n=1 Tax=Streptomyces sp. XM4193 TaxID=2929782 RepID=UPI001FFAA586|nr:MerR family transcriptional regulator [Streptomyces sp. XM4193]MCK1795162.1 MerR family transcriptional regulator [Streptomyces sp. XM4193]